MAWDSEPQTRLRALLIDPPDLGPGDALGLAAPRPPMPRLPPPEPAFTWVAARYPRQSQSPLNAGAPTFPLVLLAVLAGLLGALFFHGVPAAGPEWPPVPGGANRIALLDLSARFGLGVTAVNPYRLWLIVCAGLNAAAAVLLIRALGQRSIVAAVLATGLGMLAPLADGAALALAAHVLPVLSLALAAGRGTRPQVIGLVLLGPLAALVHPALAAMCLLIGLAGLLQTRIDRSVRSGTALLAAIVMIAATAAPLVLTGVQLRPAVGPPLTPLWCASVAATIITAGLLQRARLFRLLRRNAGLALPLIAGALAVPTAGTQLLWPLTWLLAAGSLAGILSAIANTRTTPLAVATARL